MLTSNVKDLKSGRQCPQKHCLPEGGVPSTYIMHLDLQECCRGTHPCMFLHNFAALGLEKIVLDCQPFTYWIRKKGNMNVYNIIHHLNKAQILFVFWFREVWSCSINGIYHHTCTAIAIYLFRWVCLMQIMYLTFKCGVGGAVRFLVVDTIGKEERPPWAQLWMEQ